MLLHWDREMRRVAGAPQLLWIAVRPPVDIDGLAMEGKHSEGRLNRWAVCLTQRGGGESMTISVSFRAPLH